MAKRYKNEFDKRRRDLLKIFAAAGISKGLMRASPLVSGMMVSRWAEAQTAPNKSVVIYVPDGALPEHWYPNADLTSFGDMSQPYSTVASECNFLKNMSHHRGGHGVMPTIINNSWGGDSFDVNMGRILGENLPFTYVNLGVHSNGGGGFTKDNGSVVPSEDNPFNAFNRLFGNLQGGGGDPKLNAVDAHLEAVNALKNKLGTYEQQRLDSHLTAIEETQRRLQDLAGGGFSCGGATAPEEFPIEFSTFQKQAELQADIIALALECNITASCSLTFGNDGAEFSLPYLDFKDTYHQSIHGGNGGDPTYPHYRETRKHLSSLSAYLIGRLRDRGVLDSTIVCEVTDMGNGDAHSSTDIPLIMAGGGGVIKRGVSDSGSAAYTPLHQIHTAAVALQAHEHPAYQGYQSEVIPGVLA
ncbi:DUF1552 domain-containing protein [Microbulbifer thermotolerans]|uniref:DUF1552 domain-containing protein n=1 Tax=Microbulbifer thermotolerans TaxID=252514 RepID=A0AB35HVS3_MICTH|nr:DUF1552 domain-containing protein [Microbulbifer thermotolerans]MCX2801325.1 DUF1552 domain-containing protein [Microbulbifer thermotolerans]MCX2834868.1 DUF1552 domain-containing protein [Microbulbifer thermotolerans]